MLVGHSELLSLGRRKILSGESGVHLRIFDIHDSDFGEETDGSSSVFDCRNVCSEHCSGNLT